MKTLALPLRARLVSPEDASKLRYRQLAALVAAPHGSLLLDVRGEKLPDAPARGYPRPSRKRG